MIDTTALGELRMQTRRDQIATEQREKPQMDKDEVLFLLWLLVTKGEALRNTSIVDADFPVRRDAFDATLAKARTALDAEVSNEPAVH